jgi:hypothetical protein
MVTSRILYAAPWWGLASAADRSKLERFLAKMQRLNFLPSGAERLESMIQRVEGRLLKAVIDNDLHVLRRLFPPIVQRCYDLRPRPHQFTLPEKDDTNFIPRVLFRR